MSPGIIVYFLDMYILLSSVKLYFSPVIVNKKIFLTKLFCGLDFLLELNLLNELFFVFYIYVTVFLFVFSCCDLGKGHYIMF